MGIVKNRKANEWAQSVGTKDAEAFKGEFVPRSQVSRFDILRDRVSHELFIQRKGGECLIETGYFLEWD